MNNYFFKIIIISVLVGSNIGSLDAMKNPRFTKLNNRSNSSTKLKSNFSFRKTPQAKHENQTKSNMGVNNSKAPEKLPKLGGFNKTGALAGIGALAVTAGFLAYEYYESQYPGISEFFLRYET